MAETFCQFQKSKVFLFPMPSHMKEGLWILPSQVTWTNAIRNIKKKKRIQNQPKQREGEKPQQSPRKEEREEGEKKERRRNRSKRRRWRLWLAICARLLTCYFNFAQPLLCHLFLLCFFFSPHKSFGSRSEKSPMHAGQVVWSWF